MDVSWDNRDNDTICSNKYVTYMYKSFTWFLTIVSILHRLLYTYTYYIYL